MDTLATLQEKYILSQLDDIRRGCITESDRTFVLGQFVLEAEFRTTINDEITLEQDLTFTYQTYNF